MSFQILEWSGVICATAKVPSARGMVGNLKTFHIIVVAVEARMGRHGVASRHMLMRFQAHADEGGPQRGQNSLEFSLHADEISGSHIDVWAFVVLSLSTSTANCRQETTRNDVCIRARSLGFIAWQAPLPMPLAADGERRTAA
jgi:hypothetical protein